MADAVTTSTAAPATGQANYDAATAQITEEMRQFQLDKMKFDLETQRLSGLLTASAAATNLITSAHQAAGNAAKSIGQNMVDSSRR